MNRPRLPLLRSATRLAALALATAGVLLTVATPASAAVPAGRYVALGDSYAAGPLIPTQVDLNCLRSNRNYPSLVATAASSSSFADVSCSGATTEDILSGGSGALGIALPPQLNAVTSNTSLVTVQIGGNDIGFSGIITDCAEASLSSPLGSPCKNRFTAGGVDQLQARIVAATPKVTAVLQAVRRAAPGARVVVLGYPAILPDSGYGCWPVVPIAYQDVPYLRGVEKSLNAMLASAAGANGATYADVYTPSIGRDTCKSSGTRWVEGLVPQNAAAPFHPNARGEQGMATAVLAKLNS
ncbi:SGNH/GDSL hydrolase family protein [Micromonospora zamorensis]|uniref:SGNH/GDSL hydrolase family protein n=1 Tax=Micromonospora zamorensis TaxID=709883 RepID=A0ABZ1PP09_9ACTN|nr:MULTISPECIES: SGNH/GDSL hydrolase family protein [Micromonospora]MBQ0980542.1 SGNH/GDSL hydrolase family protein [Micromonospora sp. M61]MBQ1037292.1 SGNH/GDSL hydrolase family protein [Micromonospora sp. C81]WSK48216.1 SGNH/GDSL hydrolase family protein [Micromonospora zamorensis]WTE89033.1 SGNH/GDSL hydrolase family protein [Micromonospora zamorensis]SCG47397.1 Lysophospholipase L1 [Micromonospora zamorensis]